MDRDVDLVDYRVFEDCMAGARATPAPTQTDLSTCLNTCDFAGHEDTDLGDFSAFHTKFSGD